MNFEGFIARRFNKEISKDGHEMSRPAIRIAIIGVALGLAVMLVSIAVVVGFKQEVRNQVIGFGSHIRISSFESYGEIEDVPIRPQEDLRERLEMLENVKAAQNVVKKPGIIQTDNAFQGVIMKGVDSTYNWDFFGKRIVRGELKNIDSIGNWAVISKQLAQNMVLDTGDRFVVYFVGENLKARKFTVAGIYETTFAEYDKLYILTDLSGLQQLNKWESDEYSQIEILIDDWGKLSETQDIIIRETAQNKEWYEVETINNLVPQIFEWLAMLDMNAVIILVLMMLVSGFCIISGLLILILERISTIGLFKALGMKDWSIRKIFLGQAVYLIGKGMIWGNLIGLLLIGIQYFTGIIPLDPASYYVDHVPVRLTIWWWLALNAGMVVIATAMLVIPSRIIVGIEPSKLTSENNG